MILTSLVCWTIGFLTGLFIRRFKVKRRKINVAARRNSVFNTWKTIDLMEGYRDL